MATIIKLSPHEARKIAAGEVVERPATIVKELIENSIDAGATQITLYVRDGGRELIRIVDNGCGMSEEDAALCFEHHATSKIKTVDDLETIATFGFRGEALSSIAAVSNVTLITKTADAPVGIKLELENGSIVSQKPASANTGTDITIANILDNVPARKKFLKTRETEFNHSQRFFQAFCLCYPHIHFKLFSDDVLTLNCPTTETLIARIGQVWDVASAPHMITLQQDKKKNSAHSRTNSALTITGAISNHHHARYDRNNILFFVNNRLVKNQPLARALLKGYANVLPPGRFPATCVFITVDPKTIDVNIHPRKEEVQFLHPRIIEVALETAVRHTLEQHVAHAVQRTQQFQPEHNNTRTPAQNFASEHPHTHKSSTHGPYSTRLMPAHIGILHGHEYPTPSSAQQDSTHQWPEQDQNQAALQASKNQEFEPYAPENTHAFLPDLFAHEHTADACTHEIDACAHTHAPCTHEQQADTNIDNAQQTSAFENMTELTEKNYTLLGQFQKTYLLIEKREGLYIVDQHAAHERILYELFRTRFADAATVTLMFPQIITLTPDAIEAISPYVPLFQAVGIALDVFSDHELSITATPVYLKNINFQELIQSTLGIIAEFQHLEQTQLSKTLTEKIHAQMACKAAVKAGDELTHEQMIKLLDDLEKTDNNFSCPHGRPTGWLMSSYDIEKKFKRKL